MDCTACGASAADGARFCAGCGRPLRTLDDERRVVSVVFADLVGFTTLSERLDPERVKNLVDECFERLAADVTAFGGQVDKIVGDAMVALFGAPVAHEDDAERAVRAALRMQETMAATVDELDEALRIRIGVNTGEVLVGAMRTAGSITAMGDVVNTASRLQTSSKPGEVLVGPATHAATSQAIAYEPCGLLAARGRDEPVQTWRALAPTATPGYRARRLDVPLLGRDHELGVLRHAVGSSIENDRALLVLMVGDVGMGKSRLADEAASWAGAVHGALTREGRCLPYGEANVWWPVAESLRVGFDLPEGLDRDLVRAHIGPQVAAAMDRPATDPIVGRTVDGLLALLGHEADPTVDPAIMRANAGLALSDYLGGLARRQPMVLQVSDLHWGDDALLELIDDVVTALHQLPFVVVATARPNLIDRWSPRSGRHNTMVLHLDPLDRAASAEMLERLVGGPVPAEVADVVLARSGGNPFYLEELVPLLGGATDGEGAAQAAALPDTLRGLVAARLDDLDPHARAVVQNASVIGHHGPVAGLREMGEQVGRGTEVDAALERLAAQEIMVLEDQTWSFRSDLVREVAYQTITKAERARYHLGIAHYLERVVASRRPRPVWVVDQLAHHYSTAVALHAELGPAHEPGVATPTDLMDRARRWVIEAAERARRDHALPTAARLYSEAIALLGSGAGVPAEEVARLHLGRAAVAAEAWDLAMARADVDRACSLAVPAEHPELCARALVVRGGIEQKEGDIDAAVATLSEAVAAFTDLGDDTGRAEALRQRGMVEIFGGRLADAERSATAALGAFGELGDRAGEAWADQNLAWIAFVSGRTDDADRHLEAAAQAFAEVHDGRGRSWTNGLLSWVRFHQQRIDEAERLAEVVFADARTHDDPWATAMMTLLMASIRLWSGRTDEAVELATDGLARFEAIGDPYGQAQGAAVCGRALVMAGRVDEGFALLAPSRDRTSASAGDGPGNAYLTRLTHFAAAVQIGEPDRALAAYGSIEEIDGFGSDDPAVVRGMTALQCGDLDRAARYLRPGPAPATDPNLLAAQALFLAVAGEGGARDLADMVSRAPTATYLDRVFALVAAAIEEVRSGRPAPAQEHIDAAQGLVDATDDQVAPIVVGLAASAVAAAIAEGAAGQLAAGQIEAAIEHRADALGIDPVGWRRVVEAAAEPVAV